MQQTFILIGLFFCHWLADYTHLSTKEMLSAKRFGTPLFPIFIHASIHAMLMSLMLGFFMDFNDLWAYLVILQWVSHFLIDLWKGRMNVWFPSIQNPANKFHWYVFGFDQYLHTLIIIAMSMLATS